VLEPSPPAVIDEPHRAEDPVAADDPEAIGPTGTDATETSWSSWLRTHPHHREWLTARWLAGARRLPPVPADLAHTRTALHRLGTYVIAPARFAETERFGLRWTLGGFGTPFFGADRQIRVEGTTLVDQRGGEVRSEPITSLRAAAAFLETTIDPTIAEVAATTR
jgi:hypothetical protein